MHQMMALRAHRRGGPDMLVYETAPRPEPGPGEVQVLVHAAAITFAELGWDETWTQLPATPSHEFSGVVLRTGSGSTRFAGGDEVYGLIRFDRPGAAAEYVCVPEADIALRPRRVPHVRAAAVPLAALTAWQALHDQAAVQPGERLLVHGGAGGVGAFVTQLAARAGADVTATALARDVDHVRALGATRVIDTTTQDFAAGTGTFDVVIDTIGGEVLARSYGLVRTGGRLVTLQAPPSEVEVARAGITGLFFIVSPDAVELASLASLVDAGALEVTVAQTFPLADGRAAFASGATLDRPPGKTVLVVIDDH